METKNLLIFFALLFFLFLFPSDAFSCGAGYYYTECGEEVCLGETSSKTCTYTQKDGSTYTRSCTEYHCSASWQEYRADTTGCDPVIQIRECKSVCSTSGSYCCNCGGCQAECGPWKDCEDCGSWQVAERECTVTKAGLEKPDCVCQGSCIAPPTSDGVRYYNNPLLPLNPFSPEGSESSHNIDLPVKLSWENSKGWVTDWQSPPVATKKCSSGNERCLHSYPGESQDLISCKTSAKTDCLEEIQDFDFSVNVPEYRPVPKKDAADEAARVKAERETFKEIEYRRSLEDCIKGKEEICENQYTSNKACGATCPLPDRCFPESEFAQSYVIEIRGNLRDPEKMRELEILKKALEYEGLTEVIERRIYRDRIEEIRENELEVNRYETVVRDPSFIPPFSCMFVPGESYTWRVKGCCDSHGSDCGEWSSDFSFSTSMAPEPFSTPDTDWAGEEWVNLIRNDPPPFHMADLRWCEVNLQKHDSKEIDFPSYRLFIQRKDKNSGTTTPHPETQKGDGIEKIVPLKESYFEDYAASSFINTDHGLFTSDPDYSYLWQVAACSDMQAQDCGPFSQIWNFNIPEKPLDKHEITYPVNDPEGETPVEISPRIQWPMSFTAHSYLYEIYKGKGSGGNRLVREVVEKNETSFIENAELDSFYTFRVKPCYDEDGEKCVEEWSQTIFKTTGEPPELLNPTDGGLHVPLPVEFEWTPVGGAKSYILDLNGEEFIVNPAYYRTLNYPYLSPETNYSFRVKTCAEEKGEYCGEWSESHDFTTFSLPSPKNRSPEKEEEVPIYSVPQRVNLVWEKEEFANYYKYEINYTGEEVGEECDPESGISSVSSAELSLYCPGNYDWKVASCLDINCEEMSGFSETHSFSLTDDHAREGGLVPCGRIINNPDTEWDETNPCEIKHFVILFKVIVDFLLGTVMPVIFALLLVGTGIVLYTARGNFQVIYQIRSLWKAAVGGLVIILGAFALINLLMIVLGYRLSLNWWHIPF